MNSELPWRRQGSPKPRGEEAAGGAAGVMHGRARPAVGWGAGDGQPTHYMGISWPRKAKRAENAGGRVGVCPERNLPFPFTEVTGWREASPRGGAGSGRGGVRGCPTPCRCVPRAGKHVRGKVGALVCGALQSAVRGSKCE